MPQRSYPWSAVDYATSIIISEMVGAKGFTLSEVVELSQGQLRYNRVRDIINWEKAPAKVSEFILFCEITGNSPIERFAELCQTAKNIRSGHVELDNGFASPSQEELKRPPVVVDRLISEFTKARENTDLEIKAVPRQYE